MPAASDEEAAISRKGRVTFFADAPDAQSCCKWQGTRVMRCHAVIFPVAADSNPEEAWLLREEPVLDAEQLLFNHARTLVGVEHVHRLRSTEGWDGRPQPLSAFGRIL